MGLCIFDIDNLSFCLKFPVFRMKGTLPYWESLPMSVMPIRSPPVQVVPLARVAGAMLAVNWAATGSPFRFSLSLLQAASARASVASVKISSSLY